MVENTIARQEKNWRLHKHETMLHTAETDIQRAYLI